MSELKLSNAWVRHLLAALFFFVVSALYFKPEFSGKKINAHDSVSAVGAAKEVMDYANKGETILWTNGMFSGMPAFQVAYAPKANLLFVFELYQRFIPQGTMLLFTLMLGFYFLMAQLRINTFVAVLGSIAFSMNSFFLLSIEAGHFTKIYATALMPALLGGVLAYYRDPKFYKLVLVAIFTGLSIKANHLQITYYTVLAMFILGITEGVFAIIEKRIGGFLKSSVLLVAFGLLGAASNTVTLWTTMDYSKEATRGGTSELTKVKGSAVGKTGLEWDYAMNWSIGKAESFTLLVPDAAGRASSVEMDSKSEFATALQNAGIAPEQLGSMPTYWGIEKMGTGGPTYFGAIAIFLFILSLFVLDNRWRWTVGVLAAFTLFLAWGRDFEAFNRIIFEHFPLYSKFRVPSMILTVTGFTVILGATLGIQRMIDGEVDKAKLQKSLIYALSIVGGICLLMVIGGSSLFSFSNADADGQFRDMLKNAGLPAESLNPIMSGLIKTRQSMLSADALRSLIFILLAAGSIFAFIKGWFKETVFVIVLAVFATTDIWMVDKRFVNDKKFEKAKSYDDFIAPTTADQQIMQDQNGFYRVFNTIAPAGPFNDAATSYFHHHVGGYSAVKLLRYQELIENHLSKFEMNVYNMLNTRYFISKGPDGNPTAQPNNMALGNCWFPKAVVMCENADDENAKLSQLQKPSEQVLVDKRYADYVKGLPTAQIDTVFAPSNINKNITLSKYHPDNMEYTSNNPEEGLAVFSEIWYKGNEDWKAYIDGKETKFIRVNLVLRGLRIPAGQHKVEFKFHPESHYTGSLISTISSAIILALLGFSIFQNFRKKG